MKAGLALLSTGMPLLLLTGCATPHDKYAWGTYDHSLYSYYRNPAKADDFALSLANLVKGAGQTHAVVAPGIYAEYGYLFLQQGNAKDAVKAFQSEEQQWPESKIFMDRMIELAAAGPKPAIPEGTLP